MNKRTAELVFWGGLTATGLVLWNRARYKACVKRTAKTTSQDAAKRHCATGWPLEGSG